jgi:hypothetical protein
MTKTTVAEAVAGKTFKAPTHTKRTMLVEVEMDPTWLGQDETEDDLVQEMLGMKMDVHRFGCEDERLAIITKVLSVTPEEACNDDDDD